MKRPIFILYILFLDPYEEAHGRETVRVHVLLVRVQPEGQPQDAHRQGPRRPTGQDSFHYFLQLFSMQYNE